MIDSKKEVTYKRVSFLNPLISSSESNSKEFVLWTVTVKLKHMFRDSCFLQGRCVLNPLTTRVKHLLTQSSLTFDSMDRALNCDHLLESC